MTTQKEYDSKNRLKTITVRLDDATDLRCTFEYRNNFCHTRVYDDWKLDKTPKGQHYWHIGGMNPTALSKFEQATGIKTGR